MDRYGAGDAARVATAPWPARTTGREMRRAAAVVSDQPATRRTARALHPEHPASATGSDLLQRGRAGRPGLPEHPEASRQLADRCVVTLVIVDPRAWAEVDRTSV
jgi:hypothetical protein